MLITFYTHMLLQLIKIKKWVNTQHIHRFSPFAGVLWRAWIYIESFSVVFTSRSRNKGVIVLINKNNGFILSISIAIDSIIP